MTPTSTEEKKDTSANIYQRMNRVMMAVDYIQKEKKQGMNYSIVSHDAVTAKVRPFMVAHGIVYYPVAMSMTQNGTRTECAMVVRFQNIDERSDFMDVHSAGYGIDAQDKGPGKAISYAVKYALLKALGLESGDEPDEDQKTEHTPQTIIDIERQITLADSAQDLIDLRDDLRAALKKGEISKTQGLATNQKILAAAKANKWDLDKVPA